MNHPKEDEDRLRAFNERVARVLVVESDDLLTLAITGGLDPASDFRGADLHGLDLSGEDLTKFDLSGTDLSGALLDSADLRGVNLSGADLRHASLRDALLTDAVLVDALLDDADLRGVLSDELTSELEIGSRWHSTAFTHDVFLSFSHHDEAAARMLFEDMSAGGLNVFWSGDMKAAGSPYPVDLFKAVTASRHFVLYVTEHSAQSSWVKAQCDFFHDQCHVRDPQNRRMFVLSGPTDAPHVPPLLQTLHCFRSSAEVTAAILRGSKERVIDATIDLESKRRHEEQRVAEESERYPYSHFWGPVVENRDIHIFTCGHDMRSAIPRGRGGQTTIDKWDHQTVLDITRFLWSRYPNVEVTIEDPVSKLSLDDLRSPTAAYTLATLRDKLRNRDCVIIGSPEVSDFAELVLARAHGIGAYAETEVKHKGFVHIKATQQVPSCGYWKKRSSDDEGIARIDGKDRYFVYTDKVDGPTMTAYGILVVVNNPFNDTGKRNKILILSGTDITTNGIAKLITDGRYVNEFDKLDRVYLDTSTQFEALIGTRFTFQNSDINARDARVIDSSNDAIFFKELIAI